MTDDDTPIYEIRVRGRLGSRWDAWFDGMTVRPDIDGTSVIRGPVVDQAALHGLLHKLRDIGLVLESLAQVDPCVVTSDSQVLPSTNPKPSGATS